MSIDQLLLLFVLAVDVSLTLIGIWQIHKSAKEALK